MRKTFGLLLGSLLLLALAGTANAKTLGWHGTLDLDLGALLVMSAVIGFGGSFISLALSKWMAKRSMHVQVIAQPRNDVTRGSNGVVRHEFGAARRCRRCDGILRLETQLRWLERDDRTGWNARGHKDGSADHGIRSNDRFSTENDGVGIHRGLLTKFPKPIRG